jgi:ribosome-binding factor A
MDFSRVDRLASQMLKEISDIVANELKDSPPAMTTFTRAEVTRDLKFAKVFYSVYGPEGKLEQCDEYLRRHTGVIRHMIGRRMRIRFLPEISFHYDASMENVMRINEILEQLKKDENKP